MKKKMNIIKFFSLITLFFTANAFAALDNVDTDTAPQTDVVPLIVGGQPAIDGEHPWVVYLSSSSSGRNAYCGGSLIANDWVITAAHCIGSGTIYIAAGVYNRNTSTEDNTFRVQDRYVHPNYFSATGGDDIALLKLSSPVPTSLVDVYAQLPSISLDAAYAGTGDPLKVTGWGTTSSGGSQSNTLLEVTVPVTSEAVCDRAYNVDYDTQICAGFTTGGKDSCQGDSGGPLLFTVGGQDYVAGLVSYGRGCAEAGYPGVYTRTAGFLDWVASFVGDGNNGGGNDIEELSNGESVSLSGSTGEELVFSIDVPAGVEFNATISGGNGDADLYTRFAAQPTTGTYDCRPWENGNNESCSDTNGAGTYYIMVRGYSSFSGVTLSVNYAGGGGNNGGGGTETNLSANQGSWTGTYTLEIPSGTSSFDIDISGSNGDADLYVYRGTNPTSAVSAVVNTNTRCVPWIEGSTESCSFNNPTAGTWYIRVYAYETFSGLTLEANYD